MIDYDSLLQNATDIIIKCDSYFIKKCDRSLLQNASGFFLQNATVLLQNAVILLQNVTVITKCDVYYELRQYTVFIRQPGTKWGGGEDFPLPDLNKLISLKTVIMPFLILCLKLQT